MESLLELIKEKRSIHKFTPQMRAQEIEEKIIPLVVSDPEKFEQLIKDLSIKLAKEIKKRKISGERN